MHTEGDGVEQSDEKAFRFFLRAAQQQHKQGQYYVGLFYKEGKGVDANIYEAIHWFRKAAAQGTRFFLSSFSSTNSLLSSLSLSLPSLPLS